KSRRSLRRPSWRSPCLSELTDKAGPDSQLRRIGLLVPEPIKASTVEIRSIVLETTYETDRRHRGHRARQPGLIDALLKNHTDPLPRCTRLILESSTEEVKVQTDVPVRGLQSHWR